MPGLRIENVVDGSTVLAFTQAEKQVVYLNARVWGGRIECFVPANVTVVLRIMQHGYDYLTATTYVGEENMVMSVQQRRDELVRLEGTGSVEFQPLTLGEVPGNARLGVDSVKPGVRAIDVGD